MKNLVFKLVRICRHFLVRDLFLQQSNIVYYKLTQAWTCINAHDKVRVIDGVEHYSMQRTYTIQKKIIVLCLINF